ncbi:D-glycerate 3-kinase [Brevundimonas nasdae]|uniref:kinase n=1 Tax=Brevundimonas nasdae TaxID=172043 RepID=UPI0019120107|nr:kinase [Brevundimonas nasdae]MBK6025308.1 kinase [Brevundimonas nasdae]MDQ0451910.1 D-glycerate 3-kinase [Brevundimonas nasdae]
MTRVDPGLVQTIGRWIEQADADAPPPILGIAGSQGSGKSTLAHAIAEQFGCAALSLDDVYLTKAERQALARDVHPLFATRGPPGTHDLGLLNRVLDRLRSAGPGDATPLPRFDKLADDRKPEADWPVCQGRPAAIILEGWCLGAQAQTQAMLASPVNELERTRDADGRWRREINDGLAGAYADLTTRLDRLIFLRAPDFARVLDWRSEQEAGLLGVPTLSPEYRAAISDFIRFYERLTRHMMDGGIAADFTATLDPERHPVAITGRL